VSVAVEGVIEDFLEVVPKDEKFEENCKKAIDEIKASSIDKTVKQKLFSSLDHYVKPTPKVILNHLVEKYKLDTNMVKAWEELRHKSAHGAIKIGNPNSKNNTSYYFLCLSLFYSLFMIKINYRATFRNFKDNSEIIIHYPT
jgi:hypothetical protein